jgi:CheY-like chemotaxis protein
MAEKPEGRRIRVPRAKLLVVDDVEVNLMIAEAVFLNFRVKPDGALSGRQALDMAESRDYDIVFMDYMMPGMDGVEAARHLRARGGHYADAPIVALTGNSDIESGEVYAAEGFSGYIIKPLDADKLEECLKRFLPPELIL